MTTDVLIVGAGPTGLMLANQLVRRGVPVTIIDRHAGPSRETRALGVQARTMEIYAHLGIAGHALDLGKRGKGASLWAQGRKMAHVPLGEAGERTTPYPYLLILGQDDNERIMGDKLREAGVTVQWGTELIDLLQHETHVDAALTGADGTTRTVRAAWVAGCDGAHSRVRELTGIAFPGGPYEHVFFVADVQATGNMVADEVNVYLWQQGFHLLFPMRGTNHWRIVGIVPPPLRERADLDFAAVSPSVQLHAGAELKIESCSWFSRYRIHHRSAARFRDRRCFLLGDAAHIHSPVGAQGMNTGLQDAYNLAWKLALVVKGQAGAALLDSYEHERLPVARRLLNTTDRAFRLIVSDNSLAGLLRTRVLARLAAFAMRRKPIQKAAFGVISQTGIRYRNSPLSEQLASLPRDAPQAGDRFPWLQLQLRAGSPAEDLYKQLGDTRFNLVVFGQPLPADTVPELGELLLTQVIPATSINNGELIRARIPLRSFYLIRPDGHIGLCGIQPDLPTLTHYVSQRLGLVVSIAPEPRQSLI